MDESLASSEGLLVFDGFAWLNRITSRRIATPLHNIERQFSQIDAGGAAAVSFNT